MCVSVRLLWPHFLSDQDDIMQGDRVWHGEERGVIANYMICMRHDAICVERRNLCRKTQNETCGQSFGLFGTDFALNDRAEHSVAFIQSYTIIQSIILIQYIII